MDLNPDLSEKLNNNGIHCVVGNFCDTAIMKEHGLNKAKVIVSTVPDTAIEGTTNAELLQMTKSINPKARVIVTAENTAAARQLWEQGADFVIIPHVEASEKLNDILEPLLNSVELPNICISAGITP